MQAIKTVLTFMVVGAWLGGMAGTMASSQLASWYNTPGAAGAMCDCAKVTESVGGQVVTGHLAGSAAGSLGFLVLGVLWARRRGKAAAVIPAAPPPAPPSLQPPPPGPAQA